MKRRIDKLKELGTSVVAFSGGEPMLHPDLDDLIRHIRNHGMMAGLITNGYYLVPKRIEQLNDAGLASCRSASTTSSPTSQQEEPARARQKLQHLRDHAAFDININSVLGGGIKNPKTRGRSTSARELGFSTSIGIIHDGSGLLKPLGPVERKV
jgi:molybdenum cofactor biosynthesis enzyme MoaA